MKTIKLSASILVLGLLSACNTSPASPLVVALDAIAIAATVAPVAIPNLSLQASACISAIPDLVTTIASVVEGSQSLSTAQVAVNGLQSLLSGPCGTATIPAKDQPLVTGIASAISKFVSLFQAEVAMYAPTPAIEARNMASAYRHGFVDSKDPATAKWKPNSKDKKTAKHAAATAAKIKAAMVNAPKVGVK